MGISHQIEDLGRGVAGQLEEAAARGMSAHLENALVRKGHENDWIIRTNTDICTKIHIFCISTNNFFCVKPRMYTFAFVMNYNVLLY